MRNNVKFSNAEALERGRQLASWKNRVTMEYFESTTYPKDKGFSFDFRDMYSIIPLMIDTNEILAQPESEQKEFFLTKLKEIENAFVYSRDKNGHPNPELATPYLRRVYDSIATSSDIDWDNPVEIEALFTSMVASQAIGTLVEKFPKEIFGMCTTKEEARRLDHISMNAFLTYKGLYDHLAATNPDILRSLGMGGGNLESHRATLDNEITVALIEATNSGSNTAIIDPEKTELNKLFFLEDEFAIRGLGGMDPENPGIYTNNDAVADFLEAFSYPCGKAVNEYLTTKTSMTFGGYNQYDLLLINGKSVRELIDKTMNEKNLEFIEAKHEVGIMMRNAMTDGRSSVTIMRPVITADSKVSFSHQDIKVDLNKLNKIDRQENYSAFRRVLDYFGIWKIKPRFATNEVRDANQAEEKSSTEYKDALRAAEDKFVNNYNDLAKERGDQDRLFQAFPEIKNAEENEREINDQQIDNENVRFKVEVKHELENNKDMRFSEPVEQTEQKVLSKENTL